MDQWIMSKLSQLDRELPLRLELEGVLAVMLLAWMASFPTGMPKPLPLPMLLE
jgi:hypothetical protein|uniref:Uncharacterized protein n=1 Tax=Picea glauca TaxID=3330 RepID=A0A101M4T1_PICGL|nr:hypothetical protein ABT39_MTgene937 [Picea glauca]QHR90982.1 hypothetical protein Q903MT_gene5011 [Picea sitchensis]